MKRKRLNAVSRGNDLPASPLSNNNTMKKSKSQNDRILAHLLSGKPLTAMQALNKFGSFRLAARIDQLRKQWPIATEIKCRDGKRFAVYRIRSLANLAA